MSSPSERQLRLIDDWQDGFPLVSRPYDAVAQRMGLSSGEVMADLRHLRKLGILSRIGAAVRPNTAGASTLAAMSVPQERLETVAHIVNEEPGVNHNYERENAVNLWFVVTGRDRAAVDGALDRVSQRTGLAVLDLPLERSYHINLGFAVSAGRSPGAVARKPSAERLASRRITQEEIELLAGLEDGLALCTDPYRELAESLGSTEEAVLACLQGLIADGIIARFGLIVNHRELGYTSNALVVWDVDDDNVDDVGELFARQEFVTLCYRRPRRPPQWRYNLFCMIHGRERDAVLEQVERLRELTHHKFDSTVLFSRRRFKQRGARLTAA